MGIFSSLEKTKTSKSLYNFNLQDIYRKGRFDNSSDIDYDFFENLYYEMLSKFNAKKKIDSNLLELWAKLYMKSHIDYDLGNTINLYYINCNFPKPVHMLEDYNYMPEDARKMNLLDIKHIRKIQIENLEFKDIYLATFEIMDPNKFYRPYVLLITKDENNKWVHFGYGYDSNDNGNVELFIKVFNYPIFLTTKGYLLLPLSNKKEKLDVYAYVTEKSISKLLQK